MVRFGKTDREGVRARVCVCVCVCVCVSVSERERERVGRERECKMAMVYENSCVIGTKISECFCLQSYILFCVVIILTCVSRFCYVFGAQFDVFHCMAKVYSH